MDWPQATLIFATGAGGALTLAKLLKTIGPKKETEEGQEHRPLFPNGEKEEIVQAIDGLKAENRARRRENLALSERLAALERGEKP